MAFVGAKWWKFDFHTHTPASFDYANGDITNLRQTISPREWLQSYVDKGIHCVAVTDHNTGEWIDRLKIEAEFFRGQGKEIYIFPGVEITANSNIHILGIFDPSKNTADINAVVGASKFRGTKGDSDSVAEESAENIIEEIIKSGGVAIPAHIDMKAGLCQTTAITIRQVCEKAQAVEIIFPEDPTRTPEAPLSRYNNLNLNLPSVIGSDAHHPNKVGRAFTWIKMSNPCIEGLKLALIDGTSSLIRSDDIEENGNPNLFSNLIFKSLVVKNSKYAGRSVPLNIDFNPWLNCIIGSRGSGKSSILEFIRIVMDRSNEVLELRDTNEIRKSFESFLKIPIAKDAEGVMTANSQIECIYEKDGATYSLIWNKSDNLVKIKKLISNNWVDEVGSVNSRFPIKIFSQKQIFDLAKDPTSLLKFIDESLTVNIQNWKMEWEVAVSHLKTLYSQQREKRAKISNKNILLGQSLDINHKIKLIESSNHSVLFEKHQKVIRKKSGVDKLYSELKFFIDNSKEMINSQISFELINTLNENEDKQIFDNINYLKNKFDELCNEVNEKLTEFDKTLIQFDEWYPSSELINECNSATQEYNEVIQSFNEQGISSLEEYNTLISQRGIVNSSLSEIEEIEKSLDALDGEINQAYVNVINKRKELIFKRYTTLREILEDNTSIKIDILPLCDIENLNNSFRKVIGRLDTAFSAEIYDADRESGFLYNLSQSLNNLNSYTSDGNLDDWFNIIDNFKKSFLRYETGEILDNKVGKRFIDFMNEQPDDLIDRLVEWFPEDKLKIKFHDGKKFKDVAQGSAGQKASAVLSFLLSHGTEPLILDQPEDDLDNRLITDLIVSNLPKTKKNRQIIIVTHNPNIVVNGDSEFVIAVEDRGQITVTASGGLQEKNVRQNVCHIMEGGETALMTRYKRMINI